MALSITYDLRTNKVLTFEDTTDWDNTTYPDINYGVDIPWILRCQAQGSVFYENPNWDSQGFGNADLTVDVTAGSPTTNVTVQNVTINIPLNATDNSLVEGNYLFDSYARWTNNSAVETVVQMPQIEINFIYSTPTACVDVSFDCLKPEFRVKDNTDYTVNNEDPNRSDEIKITFPSNSGATPRTFNEDEAVLGSGEFYIGVQQVDVNNELTYNFSNFTVLDTLVYHEDSDVQCQGLCELYCCIQALWKKMNEAEGNNFDSFQMLEQQYEKTLALAQQYEIAVRCGKTSDISDLVAQIKKAADCEDCCCGCDDDGTGTPVTGSPVSAGGSGSLTVTNDDGSEVYENVETLRFNGGSETVVTLIDEGNNTLFVDIDTAPTLQEVLTNNNSAANQQIKNVSDPTDPQDAVNLQTLESKLQVDLLTDSVTISGDDINNLDTVAIPLVIPDDSRQTIHIHSCIVYLDGNDTSSADPTMELYLQVLPNSTPDIKSTYMVSDVIASSGTAVSGKYTKFRMYEGALNDGMIDGDSGDTLYVAANKALSVVTPNTILLVDIVYSIRSV